MQLYLPFTRTQNVYLYALSGIIYMFGLAKVMRMSCLFMQKLGLYDLNSKNVRVRA